LRSAARSVLLRQARIDLVEMGQHLCFVEFVGVEFDDRQRPLRALPKASAQPIAKAFLDQASFAVDNLQSALRTGWYASPTPIAALFVDGNDLSSGRHHELRFPRGITLAGDLPSSIVTHTTIQRERM
jgi:hypothetical protein